MGEKFTPPCSLPFLWLSDSSPATKRRDQNDISPSSITGGADILVCGCAVESLVEMQPQSSQSQESASAKAGKRDITAKSPEGGYEFFGVLCVAEIKLCSASFAVTSQEGGDAMVRHPRLTQFARRVEGRVHVRLIRRDVCLRR